ncbi:MAG: response regulator transcription factor [Alphaproteobacteria bacterium]|nr:MAG: response regulator transcription factor [Alphaproteobacteria bacterium]
MRVLLVEDSEILGEAIRDHVAAMGHAVVWCATLAEAFVASGSGEFGVVLLDLRLPDGSGLSLLQSMREAKEVVPIVVLTAFDQISDQMEALRCGATDFLTKPFSLARLARCLQAIKT